MRHRKNTVKLGRTSSHRRCMLANMLKSLIENERIETTVAKAKFLKRHADKMITLGKKGTLAHRRKAIAEMMITFNTLSPKERREFKTNKQASSLNTDRKVIDKLFGELKDRYKERNGGYTRIIKTARCRVGDGASMCLLEYIH